jgi:Protein of unknown function (DUF2778)
MLTFKSKSGMLRLDLGGGSHMDFPAYSGAGEGRNNPALEAVPNVGPIPAGDWVIDAPYDSIKTGPYTLPLYRASGEVVPGNRSAFRIHGDNKTHDASHGCIIPADGLRDRKLIWETCERLKIYSLKVIPE